MSINEYIASLATYPCNTKPICITDLILLQKKALDMQNTMMSFKKAGFVNQVTYIMKLNTSS